MVQMRDMRDQGEGACIAAPKGRGAVHAGQYESNRPAPHPAFDLAGPNSYNRVNKKQRRLAPERRALERFLAHEPENRQRGAPTPHVLGPPAGVFFAGILITGPITITLYLVWLFISYVDGAVTPWIPAVYNPSTYVPFSIPGIGPNRHFVFVDLHWLDHRRPLGALGNPRLSEGLLARMPVVRNIYGTIKQLMETVLSQKSNAFRQCALVEWPRAGMWTVGFMTGDTGELSDKLGGAQLRHVPTTPNHDLGLSGVFAARTGQNSRHERRGGSEIRHLHRHRATRRTAQNKRRRA